MSSLGETISTIRRRLSKTMVEFARLIGLDYTSISRYESDQIVPGKAVLILLLLLSQGDEKPPLVKALGLRDDDEIQQAFAGGLASLMEYDRQAARSGGKASKDAGLTEFVKEAAAIANARLFLDPAVAEVLRRLRVSNADRRLQAHFRKFLTYLDIAMPQSKAAAAKKPPSERQRSARR